MQQLSAEKLNAFFGQLHQPFLAEMLPSFFEKLGLALKGDRAERDRANVKPIIKRDSTLTDANKLAEFLRSLEQPLQIAKQSGWLCDPWQVAGLKRDEVRNSRVLSWLLNPRGSHGFGDKLLVALLAEINQHLAKNEQPILGLTVSKNCRVKEEQCPDGDQSNRVDIEISDANFYLLIEVKIQALEGEQQLARYGDIAAKRAVNKPWGMIYLTPRGNQSKSAGKWIDKVTPMSWQQLAHILANALPKKKETEAHAMVTALLAHSFFRHIRQF